MCNQDKMSDLDKEKEALKFLDRDYNQCFQQIRHYDTQILEIFKFLFTAYSGIAGISLGLYQFGLKEGKDLSMPAIGLILAGITLGLFSLGVVIRNRVYFVQVMRYINEQRNLFFNYKPMGFNNVSKLYTDPTKPPFFDPRSSQLWFVYLISFMNSALLGIFIYIALGTLFKLSYVLLGFSVIFLIQLVFSIKYLKTREGKSAERSVFGKDLSV